MQIIMIISHTPAAAPVCYDQRLPIGLALLPSPFSTRPLPVVCKCIILHNALWICYIFAEHIVSVYIMSTACLMNQFVRQRD